MFTPMFTPEEIERLLAGRYIGDQQPWASGKSRKIVNFHKRVCERLSRATGTSCRIESRYSTFSEAWFYRRTSQFRAMPLSGDEHFIGLSVLLCRLAPYFVFMEGAKSWHASGGVSYGLGREAVDDLRNRGVVALAQQIQPLLEADGLRRLRQVELAVPLDAGPAFWSLLAEAPYTLFDALFCWRD